MSSIRASAVLSAFLFTLLLALMFAFNAHGADSLTGAKQQIRTGSKTDVQAQLADQGGVTLLNILTNNTADPGGAKVIMGKVFATAPTYTAGMVAMPWVGTDGRLQVQSNSSQLPAALGQTTMGGSTSVAIASDQSPVSVKSGTSSGFATALGTQTTIASGATTAISCASALTVSTPTKLYRIRASGAALARCTARYNNNGVFTNFGILMTSSAKPSDEIQFPNTVPAAVTTGSTGAQQWEINCNNFDILANDWNVDCSYCVSASGC